jgi:thiol-disulfide isomerase/thioredoxin
MQKLFIMLFLFSFSLGAQNKIITDEKTDKPMLIGYCTYNVFSDTDFSAWFDAEYSKYKPDSSILIEIKEKIKNVDITLIIGTWCPETKEEVPRLYKILDEVNYPIDLITIIAVDRDKKTEGDEIYGLAVDFVPTFIFYRNDSELGRIIEVPVQTLEENMLEILSQTDQ